MLYEHAAGYALFSVKEFEEVGMLLPQVESSVTDLSRFNSIVKLVGFAPFKSALAALENVNSISEGRLNIIWLITPYILFFALQELAGLGPSTVLDLPDTC